MMETVDLEKQMKEADLQSLNPAWYRPLPEPKKVMLRHLIGNINTNKSHLQDCRALDLMLEEHKTITDGTGYSPCGLCQGKIQSMVGQLTMETFDEDLENVKICNDPMIEKLFKGIGCLDCSSNQGTVKMFPDRKGVRLLNKPGKWQVYFECSHCGSKTSLWKARQAKNK